jgi:putative spermidine/putrescine transport system ATP-binding protein
MSLNLRAFRKRLPLLELRADFEVGPGERVVLAGASGAGKTSVFRFLAGLDRGAEGSIILDGREVTGLVPERREIALVFQEPIVFPALSVIENAAFGLRVRGSSESDRRAQVEPWLRRVGLGGKAEADPEQLSGGEKQRLALVRALVWRPRALLLDEPFSALDPALRQELGSVLLELHQSLTIPLLLVTHDPEEARRLGTRQLECQILSEAPRVHAWGSGQTS